MDASSCFQDEASCSSRENALSPAPLQDYDMLQSTPAYKERSSDATLINNSKELCALYIFNIHLWELPGIWAMNSSTCAAVLCSRG